MKYTFDVDSWGGHFSVPCSVATEYLKTSDGNYLKVLLCILSSSTRDIESQSIIQATGLDEDIIEDAVVHWTGLGVLKLVGQSESIVSAAVQSEDNNIPVSAVESVKPLSKAVDRKIIVSYSTKEINEKAQKDPELRHLFDEIQNYINNTINGKELGILTDLYETYHFDVPTILIAAEYCNTIGKYSIQYLSKLMIDWYEHDLCSYDEVETEIIRRTEYNTYENTVRRCFGLTNKLTTKQTQYVEKWKQSGIDESLLNIACEKCLDGTGGKINFKYIDQVISSWVNKGIKTPEQVAADDATHRGKNSKFAASAKDNSFSVERLEQLVKNYSSKSEDTSQ